MGKSSLAGIVKDHFATLVDARTRKKSWHDIAEQFVIPAVFAILSLWVGWYWRNAGTAGAGVATIAALLCSMAVFIFQLRLQTYQLRDKRLGPDDFELLDQIFHNVMWAIVVGLALALYLIAGDAVGVFKKGVLGEALTAFGVYMTAHFLLVIAMSLKRLRRAYERIAARKR